MNLNWIFFVTKALANLLEIDDQDSCQKPGSCLANHTIYDIADVAIESDRLSTELPTNEGIDNLDLEILPNLELGPTSTPPAPLPIPTSPLKDRFNHASSDCAAVILQSTPNSKGASSILSEKKDRYMLSPCNASKRWVITELCNEIRIDTIELANYEFFSGAFKKFTVSVSRSWPVSDEGWLTVGEFRAKNIRGVQTFQLPRPTPDFYRYLRIDFLDHYGNEYYCPLSLLRVYGVDQMEAFRLEEDVESVNNAKEDTPIVVHDDFEDLHKFLENSQYQDDIYVSPEEIEAFETTLYQEDLISPACPPPNAHLKNINETDFGEFEPTKSSSQQHQQPQRTPSQVNAGESIYRTINKRLATLETQSQMLSRALKDSRLAQRGLSGKVEALALRNEVRLAETMKTLERAHKETQDERDRLKSEVSYLTSEVMVGKRLSIAQVVILLAVVCIGIITRGSATTIRPLKRRWRRENSQVTPMQKSASLPPDEYPPTATRSRAASISGLKLQLDGEDHFNEQSNSNLPAFVHQKF
ncbi:hypothetical protein WALSEDRAFT_69192 [Wallemia mellicola CBS 633.66]|uniref:SUN domain-containing protein n=1 Tax=Wallemia mellicola (strain ATCC MYA-4683 / CBS 633.66) TaxID=671144 RepID=I4YBK5_WALMC|nr:hypothetical protein WALSEDRAFT_69192 [Wallemia mellicola CBS 633.66]EIM21347.1 hypothetical protein WALSEDRAFT_69192 [Wallemia mellicola CBS 633.66]|eukprot:XP_006958695.1 hypothetical protein WALSEDRAFT_69192 [Wallemia mellicola CBS 633.66]